MINWEDMVFHISHSEKKMKEKRNFEGFPPKLKKAEIFPLPLNLYIYGNYASKDK